MGSLDPPGASVTSGGDTNSGKLLQYMDRLKTRSEAALEHLLAYINVAEHSPAPAYFPELQMEYLRDRVTLVEDRTGGLLDALRTTLQARLQVEQDLELPPAPPTVDQSTPARDIEVAHSVEDEIQGDRQGVEVVSVSRRHSSTSRNLLDGEENQVEGPLGEGDPAPPLVPEVVD